MLIKVGLRLSEGWIAVKGIYALGWDQLLVRLELLLLQMARLVHGVHQLRERMGVMLGLLLVDGIPRSIETLSLGESNVLLVVRGQLVHKLPLTVHGTTTLTYISLVVGKIHLLLLLVT